MESGWQDFQREAMRRSKCQYASSKVGLVVLFGVVFSETGYIGGPRSYTPDSTIILVSDSFDLVFRGFGIG